MAKNKTTIKYKSDFRPDTQVDQIYNKETGLWEVSGAKPKSTPVKQTTKSNKVEPIYVDNPKDKRLQAYNDSLNLYNNHSFSTKNLKDIRSFTNTDVLVNMSIAGKDFINKNKIKPIKIGTLVDRDKPIYKKPVQPVIYKKNDVKVPVPINRENKTQQAGAINIQSQVWNDISDIQPQQQEQSKGKPLNDFLIQTVKTPNGIKIYKRKDRNSDFIEQYKYGGKIKKLPGGGIIGADGKSEASSGGGMSAGSIVGGVGNALDALGQFIPTDNDGFGVSRKGQKISDGVQTGLGAVADVAGNFGPIGKMVAGAAKIGQFLTKGFTAIADAVKEHKNPTDELVNEKYSPTYKDSAFSFGNNILALGGDTSNNPQNQFKQYDTVSHAKGGQNIDANNNPTSNPDKAKAEIEKQENSYKNYVFSDELGFAKLAKKINDKYKDREDLISKNTLDIELTGLMKKNEAVKKQIEQNQQLAQKILEFGGNIKTPNPEDIKKIEYQEWLKKVPEEYRNEQNYYTGNLLDNKIIPTDKDIGTLDNYKTGKKLREDYIKKGVFLPRSQSGLIDKFSWPFFQMDNKMKMGGKIPKASLGVLLSDKNKLPYEEGYVNQLISQAGINPNIPPIKALNDLNINSYKSQGADGIDIEAPNDNYGKGIAVNSPEYLNQMKKDSEFYKPGQVGTAKEEDTKKQFSPEAIAGYGIKGIEMLGHAIQAFKKPDLVNPVYNPEENKVKSLMSNRKFDSQAILDALDLQDTANRQNISDNSTSVGVTQANLQKANANQVNAIANTKIQEQQTNNQYRADEAQVLNNLGQQKMQAQVYAEDVNAKSKANVQMQRDKFLKESIGGLGDFLLKKDYVNKDNEFQMNILKSKGINFEATDYKDWNKAGVDIAKFTGELESETDTAKRKAKMEEVHQKFLAKGGTEEAWQSNSIAQGLTNKYLK